MVWNVSMAGEEDRKEKKVFTEGDHVAEITKVEFCPVKPVNSDDEKIGAKYSKSGNPYFLWTVLVEAENELEIRTTLLKGKRWLLKQLLSACGIEAKANDPDEKYTFAPEQVLNKIIIIHTVNRPNEYTYTNKQGELKTVKNIKSEVDRVKPYTGGTEAITPEIAKNGSVDDEETPF